ncbi:MAG: slipin family protein [Candidatus Obscuribacter sp.]|nr:slipin family protein [Candidatus Obscuribacter sp.]
MSVCSKKIKAPSPCQALIIAAVLQLPPGECHEFRAVFHFFIHGNSRLSRALLFCLRICNEWERKVVLLLGRFNGVRGPGLFFLIPVLETTPFTIDLRTITSAVSAEETLTKDNVPVNVDTVVYWRVVDPKLATLQVANFGEAVIGAAQTALRDIIGRSDLSQVLSDRAGLDLSMTTTLDAQTEPWGVKVESVQMRDIKIPDGLQDAMSRVAQAERESQARILLGDSELNIARRFANAGMVYEEHPIALHLRGMNMLYEVMKGGNAATVIVPSGAVDSMSFGGYAGLTALSQEMKLAQTKIEGTEP